jgi:hypothetical protein
VLVLSNPGFGLGTFDIQPFNGSAAAFNSFGMQGNGCYDRGGLRTSHRSDDDKCGCHDSNRRMLTVGCPLRSDNVGHVH